MRRASVGLGVVLTLVILAGAAAPARGSFPGRPGLLAYVGCSTARCGRKHVFVVRMNGTHKRMLTTTRNIDSLAWSPDGTQIAFSTDSGNLLIMDADGTHVRTIVRGRPAAYAPAFSPDGRHIAFASLLSSGIWVVGTDGRGKHRLVIRGDHPDWSPDGRQIAFERGNGISLVGSHGGRVHRIVHGFALTPSWSPDGRRIAFIYGTSLAIVNRAGHGRHVIASTGTGKPAWSPDGRRIAFVRPIRVRGTANLVTVKPSGRGLHVVTRATGGASVSWQAR